MRLLGSVAIPPPSALHRHLQRKMAAVDLSVAVCSDVEEPVFALRRLVPQLSSLATLAPSLNVDRVEGVDADGHRVVLTDQQSFDEWYYSMFGKQFPLIDRSTASLLKGARQLLQAIATPLGGNVVPGHEATFTPSRVAMILAWPRGHVYQAATGPCCTWP
jgi:hypothetical protein